MQPPVRHDASNSQACLRTLHTVLTCAPPRHRGRQCSNTLAASCTHDPIRMRREATRPSPAAVSYTHLRAHETEADL
eukprot:2447223-Rhodomonas_salina.2